MSTAGLGGAVLAGTAGTDDLRLHAFGDMATEGEFVHERAIELPPAPKVELLEGSWRRGKVAPRRRRASFLLLATSGLNLDEQAEEIDGGRMRIRVSNGATALAVCAICWAIDNKRSCTLS